MKQTDRRIIYKDLFYFQLFLVITKRDGDVIRSEEGKRGGGDVGYDAFT